MGGLTICPTAANADAEWLPITGTGNNQSLTLPAEYAKGVGRLIGIGYEVHCTSSMLTRQGSITCYRQNEPGRDSSEWGFWNNSATANLLTTYDFNGTPVRMPPVNSAEAVLIPGTRTWEFEKGLYQVGTFHTNENPSFCVDYNMPVLFPHGEDDSMGVLNGSKIYFPTAASLGTSKVVGTTTFQKASAKPSHLHPLHQSGCIIAGLNSGSTFVVNLNMYYETFPSASDNGILVLATPSGEYDPMALNLYSHALSCMPVGVPVGENNSGDWFFDVVSKVGKIAAPILSMIPHPIAQAAAPVAAMIGQSNPKKYKTVQVDGIAAQKKRKRVKKTNKTLASGSRGAKGKIQGPMLPPKGG